MTKKRKTNPKSPWRKKHGGLGPLSEKQLTEKQLAFIEKMWLSPSANIDSHIPGVLDAEFFETPARLTRKELEELL